MLKRVWSTISGRFLKCVSVHTMAVSQYVFFSNLASLCSHSTSSSTVEVQFQFSVTQVQRTHESSWMCS